MCVFCVFKNYFFFALCIGYRRQGFVWKQWVRVLLFLVSSSLFLQVSPLVSRRSRLGDSRGGRERENRTHRIGRGRERREHRERDSGGGGEGREVEGCLVCVYVCVCVSWRDPLLFTVKILCCFCVDTQTQPPHTPTRPSPDSFFSLRLRERTPQIGGGGGGMGEKGRR